MTIGVLIYGWYTLWLIILLQVKTYLYLAVACHPYGHKPPAEYPIVPSNVALHLVCMGCYDLCDSLLDM